LIFHKLCWEFCFFPILKNSSAKYGLLSTNFPHCLRLFRFEKSSISAAFCFDFVSNKQKKKDLCHRFIPAAQVFFSSFL